jgi:hypothetical protein
MCGPWSSLVIQRMFGLACCAKMLAALHDTSQATAQRKVFIAESTVCFMVQVGECRRCGLVAPEFAALHTKRVHSIASELLDGPAMSLGGPFPKTWEESGFLGLHRVCEHKRGEREHGASRDGLDRGIVDLQVHCDRTQHQGSDQGRCGHHQKWKPDSGHEAEGARDL